jgi:hypothetical protein
LPDAQELAPAKATAAVAVGRRDLSAFVDATVIGALARCCYCLDDRLAPAAAAECDRRDDAPRRMSSSNNHLAPTGAVASYPVSLSIVIIESS